MSKKNLKVGTYFNNNGYRPAICVDEEKCIGCALCAKTCPDVVIDIHKK